MDEIQPVPEWAAIALKRPQLWHLYGAASSDGRHRMFSAPLFAHRSDSEVFQEPLKRRRTVWCFFVITASRRRSSDVECR
jgi:hypothetical protein